MKAIAVTEITLSKTIRVGEGSYLKAKFSGNPLGQDVFAAFVELDNAVDKCLKSALQTDLYGRESESLPLDNGEKAEVEGTASSLAVEDAVGVDKEGERETPSSPATERSATGFEKNALQVSFSKLFMEKYATLSLQERYKRLEGLLGRSVKSWKEIYALPQEVLQRGLVKLKES